MKKRWMAALAIMLLLCTGFAYADNPPPVEPSAADMQQKEAIELAKATLIQNFSGVEDLLNASNVDTHFGYLMVEYEDPIWIVEFYDESAYRGRYFVMISREGNLLSYQAPGSAAYGPDDDALTNVTFAQPGPHDISEQGAVEMAKLYLGELGEYHKRMDQMTTKAYFLYGDRYNNGWEPVWLIDFYLEDDLQQKMLLGFDGSYMQSESADKKFTQTLRPGIQFSAAGDLRFGEIGFWEMSHEDRAAFSEKWIPIVEEYLQKNPYAPYPADQFYLATRCRYGVPGAEGLSQKEATQMATAAIIAMGADSGSIKLSHALYDVTDKARPVWRLLLFSGSSLGNGKTFQVTIDAKSNQIVSSLEIKDAMRTDACYF